MSSRATPRARPAAHSCLLAHPSLSVLLLLQLRAHRIYVSFAALELFSQFTPPGARDRLADLSAVFLQVGQ